MTTTETTTTETSAAPTAPVKHTLNNFSKLLADRLAVDRGETPQPASDPRSTPAVDPKNSTLNDLVQLAKKHGYDVSDEGPPTPKEHATARRAVRRRLAKLEPKERESQALATGTHPFHDRHGEELKLAKEIRHAVDEKDFDKLAKLVAYDGWNDLQKDYAGVYNDPQHKARLEVQRQADERAKVEAQRAEAGARAHAIVDYQNRLSQTMTSSKDPLVRALARDPGLIQVVFKIQGEHFRAGKRLPTPEQAIDIPQPGLPRGIRGQLEQLAAAVRPGVSGGGSRASGDGRTTSKAPKPQGQMTDAQVARHFREAFRQAAREENGPPPRTRTKPSEMTMAQYQRRQAQVKRV